MANVSVVRELGYLKIFILLGAFGQEIQGGFGHFLQITCPNPPQGIKYINPKGKVIKWLS